MFHEEQHFQCSSYHVVVFSCYHVMLSFSHERNAVIVLPRYHYLTKGALYGVSCSHALTKGRLFGVPCAHALMLSRYHILTKGTHRYVTCYLFPLPHNS